MEANAPGDPAHVAAQSITGKLKRHLLAVDENLLSEFTSVADLAETSLKSPRKLFTFIIKIYIYRIKVSKNKFI